MKDVVVITGSGQIGQAIARRVGTGKHVLLADLRPEPAAKALAEAGYEVEVATIDVSRRDQVQALAERAAALGPVTGLIHTAGVTPAQADGATILRVNLHGTALVLEAFGRVMAPGGAGVAIGSQAGRLLPALPPDQDRALALTPADELLALPFLAPTDPLHAYQLSKRGISLRVVAEALRWGQRGARLNAISPGIVMTPEIKAVLDQPQGAVYQGMIAGTVAKRAGTPDELGCLAALLMGPEGAYITGSDFLIDGGATATHRFGG